MSWQMQAMKSFLYLTGQKRQFAKAEEFEAGLRGRLYPEPGTIPTKVRQSMQVHSWALQGRLIYSLTPHFPTDKVVLYLHGGGYVYPISSRHWNFIADLAQRSSATFIVPMYGLAPEFTVSDSFPLVAAVYRQLWKNSREGRDLVVMGDSAGAGLSMALCQAMAPSRAMGPTAAVAQASGPGLPAQLGLISPWLDVRCNDPDLAEYDLADPDLAVEGLQVAGRLWAGELGVDSPLVSPLLGDLSALPPTQIWAGTADLLFPDALRGFTGIKQAGGQVRMWRYPDAVHNFPLRLVPEANYARAQIVRMINSLS